MPRKMQTLHKTIICRKSIDKLQKRICEIHRMKYKINIKIRNKKNHKQSDQNKL